MLTKIQDLFFPLFFLSLWECISEWMGFLCENLWFHFQLLAIIWKEKKNTESDIENEGENTELKLVV